MQRVLHIFRALKYGGIETLVLNVYRKLDRTRFQFDFAVEEQGLGELEDEVESYGGRIFRLAPPSGEGLWRYTKLLLNVLRNDGPFRAVHSHSYSFSGWTLALARLAAVPVRVAHSHTTSDGRKQTAIRCIYRQSMRALILQNATHLLACSTEAGRSLYGDAPIEASRVDLIRNGIDLGQYRVGSTDGQAVRRELGIPGDAWVMGTVGRMVAAKNQAFLLDVLAETRRTKPDSYLLIVGDGPLRALLLESARQRELEHFVKLPGQRSDVTRVLAAMDCFMMPSMYEGLPTAVIEAQAAGLACLTSEAVSDEAEIVPGLLSKLPLSAGAPAWAAEANSLRDAHPMSSEKHCRHLKESGINISNTVARWETVYG